MAAAVDAGVQRMLTVGTNGATCREALAAAERFPQVYAAIGRHPNEATGFDDADLAELAALAAHPRCVAIGETGLDYYRDYAPRADQERAFDAQIELARTTGKPLVIHTRAAEDDTIATLREQAGGLDVILHCFSMPDRLDECVEQGWWISFAGNVTYPKAQDLAAAAERVPDERLLVETDAPYLTPQVVRKQRNQPAYVVHTARSSPSGAGSRTRSSRSSSSATPRRCSDGEPADAERRRQPSLRRMRDFGVRPKRDLGQNFLIDSNILGVIEREARLEPGDVVLEIGGGLGVLSEYLAPRVAHVHVVELDRALEAALRDAVDPFANVTLHFADAMELDLRALDAGADEGRRQPALRHRGGRHPAHDRGARRRAALGRHGPEGGRRALRRRRPARAPTALPSVLAQLACDVRVLRPVSRSVFSPVPERRLRARRAASAPGRRPARAARARRGRVRAPPQGARRLARARAGRAGRHPRPRPRRARRARPPARRARRAPVAAGLSRAARKLRA